MVGIVRLARNLGEGMYMVTNFEALTGMANTVHDLLSTSNAFYRAPEFQRHYVWQAEGANSQIETFWNDLEGLGDQGDGDAVNDSLFLGAIVLQTIEAGGAGRSPRLSIIDGQQRLTTLYMVFTAIVEAFQDSGLPGDAADIERQYLLSQESRTKDQPRLIPTVSDTAQFRKILSCLDNPGPKFIGGNSGQQSGQMLKTWEAIRKLVRKTCAEDGDSGELSPQRLEELRDSLAMRTELVSITLGSRHDPHEIYERLNTAGKQLKIIDLTRNEVFLMAGPEATDRVYNQHWEPFEEKLGTQHQDGYFFPYALIRDPNITKASMYRNLRDYWRKKVIGKRVGEKAAQAIVKDLSEFLPSYLALKNQTRPSGFDEPAWAVIEKLQRLDPPSTTYPYLLRLIHGRLSKRVTDEEFAAAADVIDSFLVRRMFAGLSNTGIDRIFKRLWGSAGTNPQELATALVARTVQFPTDDEFREHILKAPIHDSERSRYVLTEYERSYERGDLSKWSPSDITVDRIMPKRAELKDWPGVSEEDHRSLVDTWANLVPLTKKANSEKSAGNYSQTRKMMVDQNATVFKSTRAVFDENPKKWDAKAIRKRAESLADWALERWPKPS